MNLKCQYQLAIRECNNRVSGSVTNIYIHLSSNVEKERVARRGTAGSVPTLGQVGNVVGLGKSSGNLLGGLNSSNHEETVTSLLKGLGNGLGGLGLSLSSDNGSLSLLLGLLDDESSSLGVLLGNLLLLDGLGELLTEGHVGDGDILKSNVELTGSLDEILSDSGGHDLSLGNELGGIKLGDNGLEHLVTNGGKNSLVVIKTEGLVDVGELGDDGSVEDSEGERNHLQILGAGGSGDVSGLGSDVEDDVLLEPGHEEVGSLADDGLLDTSKTVKDDGSVATTDVVHGRLHQGDADTNGDGNSWVSGALGGLRGLDATTANM